jgi:hypothetical protein
MLPVELSKTPRLTAFIEREEGGYVALCPELDIASQGDTVEAARDNLKGRSNFSSKSLLPRRSPLGSPAKSM